MNKKRKEKEEKPKNKYKAALHFISHFIVKIGKIFESNWVFLQILWSLEASLDTFSKRNA